VSDYTRLHKHGHDDYEVAKQHIHQMIGDFTEIEIFGRQVLVAVYVRPNRNPVTGLFMTTKEQKEDIWQGKAVLVLKCGPDAFQGDDGYVASTFGPGGAPKPGDWLFAAQQSGFPVSLSGDGAARVKAKDHRDEEMDVYEWDGWPCRIVPDDNFIGRLTNPTGVV